MVVFWKVIITVFLLYTIAIDGNRARRRRRQAMFNPQQPANPGPSANSFNQQPPNHPQILNAPGQPTLQQGGLNAPGQPPLQQGGQNEIGSAKNVFGSPGQSGRQYYNPYLGEQQYGYGSVLGLNYPYAGAGVGSYHYGSGQYGQAGVGLGLGQYGAYYNQYPGSNSFYSGYGSGYNNYRPGYASNYYPSSGSYYGSGNSFWNGGQKQNINIFTVFLSSLLTLVICLITI